MEAAPGSAHLTRLSPNLYWFRDTCNVYLLKDGEHGLLVDLGSGEVLDHLAEAGVRQVDWILHTHHHRDQCQGDPLAVERGIPIAVPTREAALFEEADAFWRLKKIYDNYDVSSIGFSLARSISLKRRLQDYERFRWRGYELVVQPTPGHTRGSASFLADVDGRRVAFTGDLIHSPGRVWGIHDLQWQYGLPDACGAAHHSAHIMRTKGLQTLLPSHGQPMEDAASALALLETNLRRLCDLQAELRASRVFSIWPSSVNQPKQRVLPHLWANPVSVSNFYALMTDDGKALFMDYGFPSWDHMAADMRFVEHSILDLQVNCGLKSIDVIIPSHYHDDHICGIPFLQREHGTRAWIFENMVDILENPTAYNIPCLLPQTLRVDRALKDGESFAWEGYKLNAFHMPGHTEYAVGVAVTIDGVRCAMVGDNIMRGAASAPLRAGGPVFRNRMDAYAFATGVERLLDFEPELILTGHTGALPVTRTMLQAFHAWSRDLGDSFGLLASRPHAVGFDLDPNFASFYPYRTQAPAGATARLELRVISHGPEAATVGACLALPKGWEAEPERREADIPARATGSVDFTIHIPAAAAPGRYVLCADLVLGGEGLGQVAEALVDVRAE